MMKKNIAIIYTLLLNVISFAQSGGNGDGTGGNDGGQFGVPIDNYTYILIGFAMLIIGYVAYKKNQVKTA